MGKNVVLIGMPGAGKSTVGRLVAELLGRPFLDTDRMVRQVEGREIPEIFEQAGEAYFRHVERACVQRAAGRRDVVIATGGGVVLREENMDALKKNGIVFFLDRDIEVIAAEEHAGRPLTEGGGEKARQLYSRRIGLYRGYAGHTVKEKDAAAAAGRIAAIVQEEEERSAISCD